MDNFLSAIIETAANKVIKEANTMFNEDRLNLMKKRDEEFNYSQSNNMMGDDLQPTCRK